jgi:alpha-glucosidase
MKRLTSLAAAVLVLWLAGPARGQRVAAARETLRSPDGRVELRFALDAAGAPAYSVSYDGRTLVNPSALGLVLKDGGPLSRGMRVVETRRRAHDSAYALPVGKASRARDRYRELRVTLEETGGARRLL